MVFCPITLDFGKIARGEVAEWFIAAVLKTAVAKVTGSSNLPLSAIRLGYRLKRPNAKLGRAISSGAHHFETA